MLGGGPGATAKAAESGMVVRLIRVVMEAAGPTECLEPRGSSSGSMPGWFDAYASLESFGDRLDAALPIQILVMNLTSEFPHNVRLDKLANCTAYCRFSREKYHTVPQRTDDMRPSLPPFGDCNE